MTYGKFGVDWQQRIDFNRLREERLEKANKMMHKYGIGAALIYSWDTKRYLSTGFNHPYARHLPSHPVLLIRDAGFPYVTVNVGVDDYWLKQDMPWLEG